MASDRGLRRLFKRESLKFFKKFANRLTKETGGAILIAFYSPEISSAEDHLLVRSSESSEVNRDKLEMELLRRLKLSLKGVEIPREKITVVESKKLKDHHCPVCGDVLSVDVDRNMMYCKNGDYRCKRNTEA